MNEKKQAADSLLSFLSLISLYTIKEQRKQKDDIKHLYKAGDQGSCRAGDP